MNDLDQHPIKILIDDFSFQFIGWIAICTSAYIFGLVIFRLIKIPDRLTNIFATVVFLIAMYYSFINGFIPGS